MHAHTFSESVSFPLTLISLLCLYFPILTQCHADPAHLRIQATQFQASPGLYMSVFPGASNPGGNSSFVVSNVAPLAYVSIALGGSTTMYMPPSLNGLSTISSFSYGNGTADNNNIYSTSPTLFTPTASLQLFNGVFLSYGNATISNLTLTFTTTYTKYTLTLPPIFFSISRGLYFGNNKLQTWLYNYASSGPGSILGGRCPLRFSLLSGKLPAGMSLNNLTGAIQVVVHT